MITGPIIAEIAALVGDPARATMVSALLDGRSLTAGELASAARITPQTVDLTDALISRKYAVAEDHEAAEITAAGLRFFTEFGIELPRLRSARRHVGRLCLDWTERRPHIAGAIGAAMTKRYFDLGWMERMTRGHAVIVTPPGRRGFRKTFGIDA